MLDTDLYKVDLNLHSARCMLTDSTKLTMQQAVLHHFPDAQATYRFTHRDKDVPFTRECVDAYKAAVSRALDPSWPQGLTP